MSSILATSCLDHVLPSSKLTSPPSATLPSATLELLKMTAATHARILESLWEPGPNSSVIMTHQFHDSSVEACLLLELCSASGCHWWLDIAACTFLEHVIESYTCHGGVAALCYQR